MLALGGIQGATLEHFASLLGFKAEEVQAAEDVQVGDLAFQGPPWLCQR